MCTLPFIRSIFLIVFIHQLNNVDFFQKALLHANALSNFTLHVPDPYIYISNLNLLLHFFLHSLVTSYQVSKISMQFLAPLLDITKKIQGNTLLLNIYSNPFFFLFAFFSSSFFNPSQVSTIGAIWAT